MSIKFLSKDNSIEIVLNTNNSQHNILLHNYITNSEQNYLLQMENITLVPSLGHDINIQTWHIRGEVYTKDYEIWPMLKLLHKKIEILKESVMYYFKVFVAIQTQNVKNDVNFYYGSNISDALLLYNSTYVEGGEGSDYYILSSRSRVHDKIIINNTAYDQALDFLVMPKENVEFDLRQDDKKLLINVKETDAKYTVSVMDYFKNKEKHLAIKHNKSFYKVPFIDNDNNINLIPLYTISSELIYT